MAVKIAYYISDYGYGHAARSIAVIRAMLRQASEHGLPLNLHLVSGRALPFLEQSLQAEFEAAGCRGHRLQLRYMDSGPGYSLRQGTWQADIGLLRQAYIAYAGKMPPQIRKEAAWLGGAGIRLVVSDIVPEAFPAAAKAGIPSAGISNFTWYTAYQDMLPAELLAPLAKAYLDMDRFIALPGAREPAWAAEPSIHAGFFSREAGAAETAQLRKRLDPGGERKLVCLFPGRDTGKVDLLQSLPLLSDRRWLPIVSSTMELPEGSGPVVRIPAEATESQLYVAASDLVLTKPGWGTVAEAVAFGKPLVLLERPLFREDRCTMEALAGLHPHLAMSEDQLMRPDLGGRLLHWLEAAAFSGPPAAAGRPDEAGLIAARLLGWALTGAVQEEGRSVQAPFGEMIESQR
ncbi:MULTISPECIES: hypothetical protein [unclassified Paenibacillus]|uniref:hypothetical protein n=1 Tax=unclassified Paenibacillus TaxID=185978 RepID=UPI000953DEEE|nr:MULTISPECIES: hypothetical protein [unclassified Paenibacillus]ASS66722.1 hypothetical protein CIC07_11480 [Paenibacillus sp. RUD330]SIP97576.1 hypothetical protein SAMN05880555_0177 [Paenibacillus sp. RU4X]SIQ16183.1 hypothetical protein SAMN05880570_0177 [Paenibacillus sp. RU4T]